MPKKICSILFILAVLLCRTNLQEAVAMEKFSVMLDWYPNIDHVPIYAALGKGFFKEAGLDVRILSPSDTSDAMKLAATAKVDIAVTYEPQVIIAYASDIPVKVTGRLVGHPLSTLLFLKGKGIREPKDLNGKKLGYTVPGMMDVLLDAFASINGIDSYETVNVGFSIIPSLTSGKVDAIMGPYKNYEAVEMEMKGYEPGFFEIEKMGIPDYDELIFVSGKNNYAKRKNAIDAFGEAIGKAIAFTKNHPDDALDMYFSAVPDADKEMEREAFKRTISLYAENQVLDMNKWQTFADFAFKHGLIDHTVSVKGLFQ